MCIKGVGLNYFYITEQSQLNNFIDEILSGKIERISLDFEGESNLHRYGIHLCLIQVKAGLKVYLIDTMKKLDFSGLKAIFENGSIEKIMFAADFDVKLIKHTLDISLINIFDIQIAAKNLGFDELSLKTIIERVLNYNIPKSKKNQRADWSKRPIQEKHLEYAIEDVEHLDELYQELKRQLREQNKWEHFINSCKELEMLQFKDINKTYRQVKGAGALNTEQKQNLKKFFNFRDKLAQKLDKPVFYLLTDKQMIEICQNFPQTPKDWDRVINANKSHSRFLENSKIHFLKSITD